MARETHTEVTRKSWLSRLGGAFKGILIGFVLVGGALWLLFWNEGRAVRRAKALVEGAAAVVSVPADRIDPANEGKLVHLTGRADTYDILRDDTFGVAIPAIHLERSVEMFQWRERADSKTEKKLGGGTETTTTYSYEKTWSSSRLDSRHFKRPDGHQNPAQMPYEDRKVTAPEVAVGPFRLPPGLVASMARYEPLAVESLDGLPGDLRWKARLYDGGIYIGGSPASPEIGDVRVAFRVVRPATVSVVARQVGAGLVPHATSGGGSIELLSYGAVAADAMFESAQQANRFTTWLFRALGFLVVAFGLKRIFRPLSVMADVVPALGRGVEAASGFVAYLIAAVITLITVAIAWLFYRPLLGMILLLLAGAGMVASILAILRVSKKKRAAAAP